MHGGVLNKNPSKFLLEGFASSDGSVCREYRGQRNITFTPKIPNHANTLPAKTRLRRILFIIWGFGLRITDALRRMPVVIGVGNTVPLCQAHPPLLPTNSYTAPSLARHLKLWEITYCDIPYVSYARNLLKTL
ncbi:8af4f67f-a191-47f0-ad33-2b0af0749c4a [Sclerotinia trifoliorum]|uniref:8af4f67f-a191-47f0-ad33-2b0af0749c4a n=1 Tax=Sclerotinia trifoliorum TaxID=28548 RepID=A0A8H2VZH9_9HELO|nr:8af4f67f-a191-47f0-ad33-2b0af0749c4a [Sclerotinia trifoliorum]